MNHANLDFSLKFHKRQQARPNINMYVHILENHHCNIIDREWSVFPYINLNKWSKLNIHWQKSLEACWQLYSTICNWDCDNFKLLSLVQGCHLRRRRQHIGIVTHFKSRLCTTWQCTVAVSIYFPPVVKRACVKNISEFVKRTEKANSDSDLANKKICFPKKYSKSWCLQIYRSSWAAAAAPQQQQRPPQSSQRQQQQQLRLLRQKNTRSSPKPWAQVSNKDSNSNKHSNNKVFQCHAKER